MSSYRSKLTDKLVAPKTRRDFTKDWARRILVDYMCKTDPDWLLGDVLKVIDVTPRDNPHPGKILGQQDKCLGTTRPPKHSFRDPDRERIEILESNEASKICKSMKRRIHSKDV